MLSGTHQIQQGSYRSTRRFPLALNDVRANLVRHFLEEGASALWRDPECGDRLLFFKLPSRELALTTWSILEAPPRMAMARKGSFFQRFSRPKTRML